MSGLNNFYNLAAGFYDEMINFADLAGKRSLQLKKIINSGVKTAIDIGCGTGVDSIALAKLGLEVSAFDPSEEMIKKSKNNAEKYSSKISFCNEGINGIAKLQDKKADLIISLGNTFANIEPGELDCGIRNMFEHLNEKGMAVIQMLNYENPEYEGSSIININETSGELTVRINTKDNSNLSFHIIRINKSDKSASTIISNKMYPHKSAWLTEEFKTAGFKKINLFGDLDKNEFLQSSSKNLVLIAEK